MTNEARSILQQIQEIDQRKLEIHEQRLALLNETKELQMEREQKVQRLEEIANVKTIPDECPL